MTQRQREALEAAKAIVMAWRKRCLACDEDMANVPCSCVFDADATDKAKTALCRAVDELDSRVQGG
jgi:hypothetical protein